MLNFIVYFERKYMYMYLTIWMCPTQVKFMFLTIWKSITHNMHHKTQSGNVQKIFMSIISNMVLYCKDVNKIVQFLDKTFRKIKIILLFKIKKIYAFFLTSKLHNLIECDIFKSNMALHCACFPRYLWL